MVTSSITKITMVTSSYTMVTSSYMMITSRYTMIPVNQTLFSTGEDQGEQLLVARRHCYLPVTNTLNNLLAMSQGASGVQNSAGNVTESGV